MPITEDVDLKRLASNAIGFSGADLEALAREAGMSAMRRSPEGADKVTRLDFDRALKEIKPSVTEEMNEFYQSMIKKRKAQVLEEDSIYTG